MYGYLVFTDIAKYSSLKDSDLKIFHQEIAPIIFDIIKPYKDKASVWNSWGDAIIAVFDKAETAINMAIEYRDIFREIDFEQFKIFELSPRIAGNFGEFELLHDENIGKPNVHGTMVNITARIEPVVIPGEIFVTKEFKNMATSSYDKIDFVRFEDMGEVVLAKNAGELQLYRLCRKTEAMIKPVGKVIYPSMNYDFGDFDKNPQRQQKQENPQQNVVIPAMKPLDNLRNKVSKSIDETPDAQQVKKISKKVVSPKTKAAAPQKKIDISLAESTILSSIIVGMIVFAGAMLLSFLLELDATKKLFNAIAYYTNYNLYLFNSFINSTFFNNSPNPSIVITNPITPQLLASLNPVMWLRGFIISAFIVGCLYTLKQNRIMKPLKIFLAALITALCQIFYWLIPVFSKISPVLLAAMVQKTYPALIQIILVCFAGVFLGIKYAVFLYIKNYNPSKTYGPDVDIKFIDIWDYVNKGRGK